MHERWKVWIFKLRHGLIGRWMIITCLIVLPVNIFAFITMNAMTAAYTENVRENLRGQISLFVRQIDYYNKGHQNAFINDVIADNFYALINGDTSDSVLTDVKLKNAVASLEYNPYDFTACYLYDAEKELLSFFNVQVSLTDELKAAIREQILEEQKKDSRGAVYRIVYLEEGTYVLVFYSFPYFSFGYAVDEGRLLENCYEDCGLGVGTAIACDGEGQILAAYPAAETYMPGAEYTGTGDGIEITKEMTTADFTLIYRLTGREVKRMYPRILYVYYAMSLLSIAVIPLLYLFGRRMIMNPLYALAEAMQEVREGNLAYRLPESYGTYQMDYIAKSFNAMTQEIEHVRITSYEQTIGKLQTESINAHLQVNQHMLLNSLNVVYSLIQTGKTDQAAEFTELLMKYFQYALRKDSPLVTVEEEMTFLKDYLRLQKIRFPEKFTTASAVDEEAKPLMIPQLIIQGFVENAVKYALSSERVIEILITVTASDGRLRISVTDTGEGMPPEILSMIRDGETVNNLTGKHVGLRNARIRLKYYYGDQYTLHITSEEGQGTQVFLDLPEEPVNKEEMVSMMRREEIRQL